MESQPKNILKTHAYDASLDTDGYLHSRTGTDDFAVFADNPRRNYNVQYEDLDGYFYKVPNNRQFWVASCIICSQSTTFNTVTKNDLTYTESLDISLTIADDVPISNVRYEVLSNTRMVTADGDSGARGFITIDIPNPSADNMSVHLLEMSKSTGVGSIKHYDYGMDYMDSLTWPVDESKSAISLRSWPWIGYYVTGGCRFSYEYKGQTYYYSKYVNCPQFRYNKSSDLKTVIGPQSINLSQGNEKEIEKNDKVVTPRLRRAIPINNAKIVKKNKPKTAAEINGVVKEYEATINSAIKLAGSATADWTPAKRAAFRRAVRRAIRVNCRRNIEINIDDIILGEINKVNGSRRLLNDLDQASYSVTFTSDNEDDAAAFIESASDDSDLAGIINTELQSEADFDTNNDLDLAGTTAESTTSSTDVAIYNYYDPDAVCQWVSADL